MVTFNLEELYSKLWPERHSVLDYRPPRLSNVLLRSIAGTMPPQGQLPGNIWGGLARAGGTAAGIVGGEMERTRTDPFARKTRITGRAIEIAEKAQKTLEERARQKREEEITGIEAKIPELKKMIIAGKAPPGWTIRQWDAFAGNGASVFPLSSGAYRGAEKVSDMMKRSIAAIRSKPMPTINDMKKLYSLVNSSEKQILVAATALGVKPEVLINKPELIQVGSNMRVYERDSEGRLKPVIKPVDRAPSQQITWIPTGRGVEAAHQLQFINGRLIMAPIRDKDGQPITKRTAFKSIDRIDKALKMLKDDYKNLPIMKMTELRGVEPNSPKARDISKKYQALMDKNLLDQRGLVEEGIRRVGSGGLGGVRPRVDAPIGGQDPLLGGSGGARVGRDQTQAQVSDAIQAIINKGKIQAIFPAGSAAAIDSPYKNLSYDKRWQYDTDRLEAMGHYEEAQARREYLSKGRGEIWEGPLHSDEDGDDSYLGPGTGVPPGTTRKDYEAQQKKIEELEAWAWRIKKGIEDRMRSAHLPPMGRKRFGERDNAVTLKGVAEELDNFKEGWNELTPLRGKDDPLRKAYTEVVDGKPKTSHIGKYQWVTSARMGAMERFLNAYSKYEPKGKRSEEAVSEEAVSEESATISKILKDRRASINGESEEIPDSVHRDIRDLSLDENNFLIPALWRRNLKDYQEGRLTYREGKLTYGPEPEDIPDSVYEDIRDASLDENNFLIPALFRRNLKDYQEGRLTFESEPDESPQVTPARMEATITSDAEPDARPPLPGTGLGHTTPGYEPPGQRGGPSYGRIWTDRSGYMTDREFAQQDFHPEDFGKYGTFIIQAGLAHGLDPRLIWSVMMQESRGVNRLEDGPDGDRGLMQVRKIAALDVGADYNKLKDPKANLLAGAAYLKKMLDRFDSLEEALGAYNQGPTRTSRTGMIPTNYLDKVLTFYQSWIDSMPYQTR